MKLDEAKVSTNIQRVLESVRQVNMNIARLKALLEEAGVLPAEPETWDHK